MKLAITLLVAAFGFALVSSVPVPEDRALGSQALDRLVMVEGDNEESLRSKRTIGILRQLFPGISQMIEQKVSAITSEVIRILGPVVLRGVLGNGGGGGGGTNTRTNAVGTTVEVESPFGDDDDDDSTSGTGNQFASKSPSGSKVSISLPTYPPDEDDEASATTMTKKSTTTPRSTKSSV